MTTAISAELRLQEVLTSHSRVSSICAEISASKYLLGAEVGSPAPGSREAPPDVFAKIAALCHGYSRPSDGNCRFRNAPSAGARYPIELLLADQEGGRLYWYDLQAGEFRNVGALNEASDGGRGYEMHLAAVLWRTVQRYGVRGLRYCLLDATAVASNVAELSFDFQGPRGLDIRQSRLSDVTVSRCQSIRPLLSLKVDPHDPGFPEVEATRPLSAGLFSEQTPLLSPTMARVQRFYNLARETPRPFAVSPAAVSRGIRRPFDWLPGRRSAKSFTGEPLSEHAFGRVHDFVRLYLDQDREANGDGLAAALIRMPAAGARARTTFVGRGLEVASASGRIEQSSRGIAGNFQGQKIVETASLIVVVGVHPQVRLLTDCAAFEHWCVRAGLMMSDLYRFGYVEGIANTAIGGFSDKALQLLLGANGFFPIVAHAFGREGASRHKFDAEPMKREGA